MEGLRIHFRKHQLLDSSNNDQKVVVQCGAIASYVPGEVDQAWYEMTEFTEGLEKLQITWDAINNATTSNEAGSNYDKGLSLSLTFSRDAFTFIWNWLLSNPCQMLNSIDVRIDDVIAGKSYRLFEIKCDNIKYQPENDCMMEVQLREQDTTWHCVHKTFIWDDWNGFMSTQEHPCFLTCVEPRPRLVNSARMGILIFIRACPITEALNRVVGLKPMFKDARNILNADNFVPSPLIRDYINNVAGKCGMTADTIFHRSGTPEYNACIFHPLAGAMHDNDNDDKLSPSLFFKKDNRWNVTLAEFLDLLKVLYCSEWYITATNQLVFKPTQELIQLSPILDFTTNNYPVRDLAYTFSGTKKAAYGRYQYQVDGGDMGSQEIGPLYNDITDYDGPSDNPMLEGETSKNIQFGATAFIRDGRVRDYTNQLIEDGKIVAFVLLAIVFVLAATQTAGTFSIGAGLITAGVAIYWASQINEGRSRELHREFRYHTSDYTGAVRLVMSSQTLTPRILIWDGVNKARAKVVAQESMPVPNTYYNPDATPYDVLNEIGQDNSPKTVFNYPVYFDSNFQNNLFDRFHDQIDNPLKSLETNQEFEFNTDLCTGLNTSLGLWSEDTPKIGYLVKIEKRNGYDVYGRIRHIQVDYDTYTITLKGVVIKKSTI